MNNIKGEIKVIGEIKTFGSNGFEKRDLVIETPGEYPQKILIEFTQGNCELLENFELGESVKVAINLRGREWVSPDGETKYFNSINGWKIDPIEDF